MLVETLVGRLPEVGDVDYLRLPALGQDLLLQRLLVRLLVEVEE